jgi:hypothetical protein
MTERERLRVEWQQMDESCLLKMCEVAIWWRIYRHCVAIQFITGWRFNRHKSKTPQARGTQPTRLLVL